LKNQSGGNYLGIVVNQEAIRIQKVWKIKKMSVMDGSSFVFQKFGTIPFF